MEEQKLSDLGRLKTIVSTKPKGQLFNMSLEGDVSKRESKCLAEMKEHRMFQSAKIALHVSSN